MAKQRGQSSIPAFLQKTYDILENSELVDIVGWNEEGTGFVVKNIISFQDQVLPMYFKHRNFASFVRQMNMYGFHKSRSEVRENEFIHPYFKRDSKHLLKKIKRKSGEPLEESYIVSDLKPYRNQNKQEMNTLMDKHNELEKVCKILIDQNNKILKFNQQLRNQLLEERAKGQMKRRRLQDLLLGSHEEGENFIYLGSIDRKQKLLSILQTDDEEDKQMKIDDSDSTIEKQEQLGSLPQPLMLTQQECDQQSMCLEDLSNPILIGQAKQFEDEIY